MEGITSYYEVLLAVRAGLLTPAAALRGVDEAKRTPRDAGPRGAERRDRVLRRLDPLYRPDENSSTSRRATTAAGS